jgi:transcriptional regulator with XRE-family HTH domain
MTRAASPIKTIDAASLLNRLQADLRLATDRALAQRLGVNAPLISKIRSGRSAITASFLVRAHEVTGHSIRELRSFMGDDAGYFTSYRGPAETGSAVVRK